MINVSILGATGYVGIELLRLLLRHPNVNVVNIGSKSYVGKKINEIYPIFNSICEKTLKEPDLNEFAQNSDVVFIALPNGIASKTVDADILKDTVIIDMGADFRLKELSIYEKWYQIENNTNLINKAVYGLPELHKEEIKSSNLIANPGCYTTTSILSLSPLIKNKLIDINSIIIDAASGVTGAGRSEKIINSFCEVDENFKAYGLVNHRHVPEIEQELSLLANKDIIIDFTPHLIPMERGILATSYAFLNNDFSEEEIRDLYLDFYKDQPFVRILNYTLPETKYVKGSNYIDINFKINKRNNRIIVLGALDNLMKGAAGQAVQNMNIRFGYAQDLGLNMIPDSLI